eukprot:gene11616-8005_t
MYGTAVRILASLSLTPSRKKKKEEEGGGVCVLYRDLLLETYFHPVLWNLIAAFSRVGGCEGDEEHVPDIETSDNTNRKFTKSIFLAVIIFFPRKFLRRASKGTSLASVHLSNLERQMESSPFRAGEGQ